MTAGSRFPPGWDEERLQRVLARYEGQSEDEAMAEDEALQTTGYTVMTVPSDLVPDIRVLIAKREAKRS